MKLHAPDFPLGRTPPRQGAARAVQRQSEGNTALLHDNIVRDEMNGWTALVNSRAQVDATEQSLRIAGENLDISTYSYGEGPLYDPRCVAGAAELDTALHQCDKGSLQLCRGGGRTTAHHGAVSGGRQALPGRPSRRGCLFRLRKPHGRDRLFGTPAPVLPAGAKKRGFFPENSPFFVSPCLVVSGFRRLGADHRDFVRYGCDLAQHLHHAAVLFRAPASPHGSLLAWSSSVSHSML